MARHDFGHYDNPCCGGVMKGSGKGNGPKWHKQRHQKVLAFPAWHKGGTDVYFSSRWDNTWQTYDQYHTPKNINEWWSTAPHDWVFVGEVPYHIATEVFVWAEALNPNPTVKYLKKKRHFQRVAAWKRAKKWPVSHVVQRSGR